MAGNRKKYEVGYKKPPRHTQWKPGQPGNKNGRPPGSKNFSTILKEVFAEKVAVRNRKGKARGKARLTSKLEAAVRPVVDGAIAGNLQQQRQLMQLAQWLEGRADALAPQVPSLSEADRQVIAQIHARLTLYDQKDDHV